MVTNLHVPKPTNKACMLGLVNPIISCHSRRMELDETGLSALANFADAAVASPGEFEALAEAAIDDARRYDSAQNSNALAAALAAIGSTLSRIEAAPAARTVETMMQVARTLREREDGLAREAGRALVWALENQLLLAARSSAEPIPSGLHPLDQDERERSRPVSIQGLETRHKF
jgi:hypothetical protein